MLAISFRRHACQGEASVFEDEKVELEKLLRKVEAASKGSPELDREFASAFPSAPPNVTRSIDAVVGLIETELPGWWWTCGYCTLIPNP